MQRARDLRMIEQPNIGRILTHPSIPPIFNLRNHESFENTMRAVLRWHGIDRGRLVSAICFRFHRMIAVFAPCDAVLCSMKRQCSTKYFGINYIFSHYCLRAVTKLKLAIASNAYQYLYSERRLESNSIVLCHFE